MIAFSPPPSPSRGDLCHRPHINNNNPKRKRLVYAYIVGPYKSTAKNISSNVNNNKAMLMNLWCLCQEPVHGKMVQGDNKNCQIKWFHIACAGLRAPKGNWYCED
ncbi:hypothetical protein BDA99DRAFT_535644 [Phascolomyces articulosus]|uniref:Zinc finger PHD-type domain-containing protein n=1 Tax=Phascolomyces articulosus TaxID=60185 RepID=A0AAD5PFW4_9FUNG|nr:hypothetical protein BDA99DRAFT_535644 [Phascolomyces articulosus]